jgi:acetyl-CoA carboxylase carboxyltransferase component
MQSAILRTAADPAGYHWLEVARGHGFLDPIFDALAVEELKLWVESGLTADSLKRTRCAGHITATAELDGRTVAIAWSDFRVNAGSYGHASSRRFAAFLRRLRAGAERVPLLYIVNSAGVSLMEGRSVSGDAFTLWPELLEYAATRPFLTCAVGRCLGLAPLLFGLGHYRVAVAGRTHLNLTGPDVLAMFFGRHTEFDVNAAAERFVEQNDLIHEIVPSVGAACARFRRLLAGPGDAGNAELGPRTAALLGTFLDATPMEVVPGWCGRVRVLLGSRGGRPLGVFVNPLERADNMIGVRTLDKYAAGLELFGALGVPVVSLLDSPGVDPRFDQSDANNLRRMLAVGERIIRYPHGVMGVVTRRCFGGAGTLSFPKVFGGQRALALRGACVGTMHESIIERQLAGSPRLLAQWRDVAARQGPELHDMIEHGIIDAVIETGDLPREIDEFLDRCAPRPAPRAGRPRRLTAVPREFDARIRRAQGRRA